METSSLGKHTLDEMGEPTVDELVRRLDRLWKHDFQPELRQPDSLTFFRHDRYQLIREIGRGSFGLVYLAIDSQFDRAVAIKIPRAEVLIDRARRRRFETESKVVVELEHPGIVSVLEADAQGDPPYIVAEYCRGPDLGAWLDSNTAPIPVDDVIQLMMKVAAAVGYIHDNGVLHRDLKPANILLEPIRQHSHENEGLEDNNKYDCLGQYHPRVTDFGLSRLSEFNLSQTRSSLVIGTPNYMAPERIGDDLCELQAVTVDIYSLGVMLYELLTGRVPFQENSLAAYIDRVRSDDVPSPRLFNPQVPSDVETICLKALEKSPCDRYRSCHELEGDLCRYLQRSPIHAKRPGVVTRFQRWLSRPARIKEAGILSIMIGITIPFWIGLSVLQISSQRLDADVGGELVPQAFVLSTCLLWPLIWIGKRALDGSKLALQLGLLFSIANLVAVVLPLIGDSFVFSDLYERHPIVRITVYTILSLLFGIQSAQYAVVWISNCGHPLKRLPIELASEKLG